MLLNLCRYFEWVSKIHGVFLYWNEKFKDKDLTDNDLIQYICYYHELKNLGDKFYASSLIWNIEDAECIHKEFLDMQKLLNQFILCSIPDHHTMWYSLPALLEEYGLCLPQEVQETINCKITFPGSEGHIPDEQLSPPIEELMSDPSQVFLQFHKNMTYKEVINLVSEVNFFYEPIAKCKNMMIFFKFMKSALYDNIRHYHLKRSIQLVAPSNTESAKPTLPASLAVIVSPSASTSSFNSTQLPIEAFAKALNDIQALIFNTMNGTAKYWDIVMGNEYLLEQLDINREVAIIKLYARIENLDPSQYEGLVGVQSMLEIFQCRTHVENISSVCEQYRLEACRNDPLLQELIADLTKEDDKYTITLQEAIQKMKRVREILCLEEEMSLNCLDIFPAIMDSAAFYHFVKDNNFIGQQGENVFMQQYQLITGQLQHEEYNEQVLHHLYAAFKVISPFMDDKKGFAQLMKEVTALNPANSLEQLKTVNAHIMLINFWFSRAEV